MNIDAWSLSPADELNTISTAFPLVTNRICCWNVVSRELAIYSLFKRRIHSFRYSCFSFELTVVNTSES